MRIGGELQFETLVFKLNGICLGNRNSEKIFAQTLTSCCQAAKKISLALLQQNVFTKRMQDVISTLKCYYINMT